MRLLKARSWQLALLALLALEVGAVAVLVLTVLRPPGGTRVRSHSSRVIASASCPATKQGFTTKRGGTLACRYDPNGVSLITDDCRAHGVRLDSKGIPLVKINGVFRYNKAQIAMCGLNEFNYFRIRREPERLVYARHFADWLVANQDRRTGSWLYSFGFPVPSLHTRLRPPWPSALAQGLAISFLARMATAMHQLRYLRAAERGTMPFEVPSERGGVVARLDGHPFYEGLPTTPPNLAMEDFLTSLIGLYDLKVAISTARVDPASLERVSHLYDQGLQTLKETVHLFDIPGRGSVYFLGPYAHSAKRFNLAASPAGTRLNATLLRTIYSVSPDGRFLFYANRWTKDVAKK